MPPPTPKKAEKTPAASPMATRRTRRIVRAWSVGSVSSRSLVIARESSSRARAARQPPTGTAMYVVRPRPTPLPEPAVRRLLGRARERRADSLLRRPAAAALLRRASRRPQTATTRRHSRRRARPGRDRRWRVERLARSTSSSSRPSTRQPGRAPVERRLLPRVDTGIRLHPRALLLVPRGSGQRLDRGRRSSERRPRGVRRDAGRDRARAGGAPDEGRPLRARTLRVDAGRRTRLPRAAPLPQSAAASRLRTSQASRTSSSVVRKLPIASRSW